MGLLLLGVQTAHAEAPPIYKTNGIIVGEEQFFDFARASDFWTDIPTFPALEDAWARCENNKAVDYWNRVWFSWFENGNSYEVNAHYVGGERPQRVPQEYTADFVFNEVVQRYGKEGVILVKSDSGTVKYCHDLLRTYEEWREAYDGIFDYHPDWGDWVISEGRRKYIDEPFNKWSEKRCDIAMADRLFYNECNSLPDWRLPQEVENYDTALLNNEIRKVQRLQHDAQQRAESRKVIEQHLAAHRDTLSDADRKALEAMIVQLQ